ncbi:hypothetical protein A2774_05475 [Candidatus Roizmanbacteria bacterium RIFCSPHIGHO2_01_FULL_39_12c]|uniref:Galactose-1-phosphate uridyl transferase N-terminal domain-containing protein n=1 Tax=Candidatus Roizmanbacteria bacterium RIFCSPHIGHO2_01_FULL_39_12c TaxID=1802031 RepID=A0A1F7GET1_9BACT|nr:MAG: hypothetical protein A2774_05475 [Candidatus Roizmanbacteria bacterium RIFCSPHIGHO2_01_FULL_39_12c]OGK46722.1 MAG: hypothetical protein A2963_00630 [Candidatus Roizmanbacteria bacterium RIFCSPLOWO2_01_FULL_40_13]
MSKYVPDISTHRWVVISPQRLSRPDQYAKKHKDSAKSCPFCENRESETPPEVYRIGEGEANKPGWKIRVVPNKYSITDIHEVILHSPDHVKDIENLNLQQVNLILSSYRQRFNNYRKKGQVLIFCNHGEHAGASLTHPHAQLVVIPSQINLDTLIREPLNNQVEEKKLFRIYCPDFSQWPYEIWIVPIKEGSFFGDITDDEIKELSTLMIKMLKKLEHIYQSQRLSSLPFGYNYYFYHKENWYLRIIPRFIHRAGFELGTGLYVNIVDPLEAALELKGVERKMMGVLRRLKKY